MKEPILEMRGITKKFGSVTANKDVDLTLYPGEIHALLGENGAGKSTLMNIIGVLDKPTSGEYTLDGVDIHKADDDELAGISAKLNRIQQKCSRCTGAFFVVYFCLNDKNGVVFALGCI